MNSFLKQFLIRILTFFTIIFLSVIFLIEFSVESILFSIFYLISGKQFELLPITRSMASAFSELEYVEAVF